jgi:hypothetical protein
MWQAPPTIVVFCAGFALATIVIVASTLQLSRRMKLHHPDVWRQIADPSGNVFSLTSKLAFARFLFGADYLEDPELRSTMRIARVGYVATICIVVAVFAHSLFGS